ncbi:sprT-like domain-containing protein Spartan isoform X2 [Piliocolobus tephrosceles]|uniref:sprT-like domain-containing protein Spartan isoform X2 n=1 Tax=Piliocolobus tephrosceles TaxID=591936 RepID=UPI000E6B4AA5|nr:sprT-like domain-containing protein Spartan isoform X2 [Piliocolobus tephrosceles]
MDDDLMLALRLQEEWNLQEAQRDQAQESLSLVDASWELVDPTPDLQALFVQFNDQFFWGQLEAVEVKWSVRMTLCAGICSYEGKGGMCSIRLSEPLLKLRPRKDLVEVYHTFHDEVDEYRRHWWRCDGPCQHRPPYYGYVKRATNREPSAHDYWWAEHQKTCGGTYMKIKEPENYSKKGKGKTKLGKQPVSAAENKDKPNRGEAQLVIPFSGKGYVLGETSNLPSPGKLITSHAINKTQDLLNQNHSANAVRPNSKIKVKFEQNDSSKNYPLVSPAVNNSHQNVLSNYFPRVSVANQKAFRGVNGSPRKSETVGNIPKNSISSSSQRRVSSSKISLRNSSKVMESTSVMPSRDVSGSEDTFPNKRPRLEDKTVFDNFFIKKKQIESSGNDPKYSSYPTTTTQNSSSSSSQSKMVNCPVCQNEVLESQINEHLDWCLKGYSIKVKS